MNRKTYLWAVRVVSIVIQAVYFNVPIFEYGGTYAGLPYSIVELLLGLLLYFELDRFGVFVGGPFD